MSKFYAIHAIPVHSDDWELIGVLTKECDALLFVEECKGSGDYLAVAKPQHLDMAAILDILVRDRLRQLAEPIIALANTPKTTNAAITMDEFRQVLSDLVPGFAPTLAAALELTESNLYGRIKSGGVSKIDAMLGLAKLAISRGRFN